MDHINRFFDIIKLIAHRLPDLGELLVQVALIVFLIVGLIRVLKGL